MGVPIEYPCDLMEERQYDPTQVFKPEQVSHDVDDVVGSAG
jgi:hypothetical protein